MINRDNLRGYWFTGADIEAACNSLVPEVVIRDWVQKGKFNETLPEGARGKPRKYPLNAVYEAVIMSHLSKLGVSLDDAKEVNLQVLDKITLTQREGHIGWIVFGSDNLKPIYTRDNLESRTFGEFAKILWVDKKLYYGASQTVINVQAIIDYTDEILLERIKERMRKLLNDPSVTGE